MRTQETQTAQAIAALAAIAPFALIIECGAASEFDKKKNSVPGFPFFRPENGNLAVMSRSRGVKKVCKRCVKYA